ncbi:hypothetical protein A0H77_19505 [Vibrio alginolyticus]|uniref:hypothetical protein n=1 Tax=Vibrio alginolyticus TaxID=663 RepID=UPI00079BFE34|nr:hypothetical protein [Vibrio alginolyticus]KXZ35085.1 hypothetical protein A0H77_19505 [Vibrio alginolyticus]
MNRNEFENKQKVYQKIDTDRKVLINELKILINEIIASRSLSQKQVGLLCQLPQSDISNILNDKKLNKFTYERLLIAKRQLIRSNGKKEPQKNNKAKLLKKLRGLIIFEISKKLKRLKKRKLTQIVIAKECETLQNQISYLSTISDSSYKITYDYLKKIAISIKIDHAKIKSLENNFIK